MKYYLTIILTISSLLIAQDTPQVPGWGVYFGGALNSASIDPLNDGFDIERELNLPFVGVSKGITFGNFPIPVLIGAGLGKRGYSKKASSIDYETKWTTDWLDLWVNIPYPAGPVFLQAGFLYGFDLGSGKTETTLNGDKTEEEIDGDFGENTDLALLLSAAYPLNEKIGLNVGYAIGLEDHGSDGTSMKFDGLFVLLGYNF